ncbi:acyl-CoA thioesterase II [Cellulomonas fimi]|uniref:Acyl-CoA thioesterase 2 n=1 Tax=Cellulomonas fimi TaxID=1708 RepID=A0A7Y0LWW3_CELFI|nr:acyl-CoA thioesterase II [Cellulomonas fimi]NMR19658.1 acyl-CoA thioesterase II [Cellulomonas fimi]
MTHALAHDPMARLLAMLELSPEPGPGADDRFTGSSLPQPHGRVFGGQVLAQALLASGRTVGPERLPHSLHAYFLRPGDADRPISFAVERLRDGRSFSARRTHALQNDRPILTMSTSFQEQQEGLEHADPMPDAPPPDEVVSARDVLGPIDHPIAQFWIQQAAFDLRHVDESIFVGPAKVRTDRQLVWIRARGPVPDDQLLHRALMAYACDQVMLESILRKHGQSWVSPGLSMASLDHAMWWHRPARVDEWLLYAQRSPSAQGGRGLATAEVFTQDGRLVATIAQEGMVRLPL